MLTAMVTAPLWARVIRYVAELAAYWTSQSWFSDADVVAGPTPAESSRMVTLVFTRNAGPNTREDIAEYTFHFIKSDAGANLFLPWAAGDYTTIETALGTMWTSMRSSISTEWTLAEYRWHQFGSDIAKPGPRLRTTTVGTAGTATGGRLPDQVAMTVTFRTASRRHWGRVYIGGFPVSVIGNYGQFATGTVDTIALAVRTCFNTADAANLHPVIWSQRYLAHLGITELAVDATPDVVRRRRRKTTSYWRVYTS